MYMPTLPHEPKFTTGDAPDTPTSVVMFLTGARHIGETLGVGGGVVEGVMEGVTDRVQVAVAERDAVGV